MKLRILKTSVPKTLSYVSPQKASSCLMLVLVGTTLASTYLMMQPTCSSAQSTQPTIPNPPGVQTPAGVQTPTAGPNQRAGQTPLPAAPPADFAPTNYVTQFAEQEDGAFSPQAVLEGTMDTLLAPLSGAFNIVHDITSAVFSAIIKPIGQLAGSILALFIKEVMKPLTTYLMGILQWFVLNPNIPLALDNGGDSQITGGQVNPFAADKKFDPTLHNLQVLFEQMKTLSLDLSLVIFIFSIWRKWLEGAFRRSENLMGSVGRLIFTMMLILTWREFYKMELMITNEMVKAIFFNSPVEFQLLNSALIDALLAAIAAGGGLAVETFAPVIGLAVGGAVGNVPGAVIGGAIGAVIGFIGLVMFAIFGAILIAQMVYLLVLKAIQTALLVAQYVFADMFLVFYASPDTEHIATTYIKSFIEVSLWTFAWLGLFKIMVIVLASQATWGKILIVIGLLQIMISIPKWIANAQISPASDFINPKMMMGHIQEGAKRIGKVAEAMSAGAASSHVDGNLIKQGRSDSTFTAFGGQNLSTNQQGPSSGGASPAGGVSPGPTRPPGGGGGGGGQNLNTQESGGPVIPGAPPRRPPIVPNGPAGSGGTNLQTPPNTPQATLTTPGATGAMGSGTASGIASGASTGASGAAGGAVGGGAATGDAVGRAAAAAGGPAGILAAGAAGAAAGAMGNNAMAGKAGSGQSASGAPETTVDMLRARFNRQEAPGRSTNPGNSSSAVPPSQQGGPAQPKPKSKSASAPEGSLPGQTPETGETLNFAPEEQSQEEISSQSNSGRSLDAEPAPARRRPTPPPIPAEGSFHRAVRSPINANDWFQKATTGLRQFQEGPEEGLRLDRFGRAGVSFAPGASLHRRAQLGVAAAVLEQGAQDGGFLAAAKRSVQFNGVEGVAAALHLGGRTGTGVRQFVDTELGKERMRDEMNQGTMHYVTGGEQGKANAVSQYLTHSRGAYGDNTPNRGRQVQDDLQKYSFMISPARLAADHNVTADAQSSSQVATPMRDGLGKYIERQFADGNKPPGSYGLDQAIAFSEKIEPPLVWGAYAVAATKGPDAAYDHPDLVQAVAHIGSTSPGMGSARFKYESALTALESQRQPGDTSWRAAEERVLKLQSGDSGARRSGPRDSRPDGSPDTPLLQQPQQQAGTAPDRSAPLTVPEPPFQSYPAGSSQNPQKNQDDMDSWQVPPMPPDLHTHEEFMERFYDDGHGDIQ